MMEVDDAFDIVDLAVKPVEASEQVPADESAGRLLAEPLIADFDEPAFDNSAMDGYLFNRNDLKTGKRMFRINGVIRPEDSRPAALEQKECSYITTGSRIPKGGDFVIPVELTVLLDDGRIRIKHLPEVNAIRKKGEGYHQGDHLIAAGKRIQAVDLGLFRINRKETVSVKRRLKVAVLATGSELDSRGDSNTPAIAGLFSTDPSVEVTICPVVGDDRILMAKRFETLLEDIDILITTGGVSAGEYDYVIPVLESLGAQFHIRKVNQKPGKPFSFAQKGRTQIFCLPGNPVSAFFCAVVYVRRMILQQLGLTLPDVKAKMENSYQAGGNRTEFVPATLAYRGADRIVSTEGGIRSHLLHTLSGQNCFVRIDPGRKLLPGDTVALYSYDD